MKDKEINQDRIKEMVRVTFYGEGLFHLKWESVFVVGGERERSKRILSAYYVYEHIPDLIGDEDWQGWKEEI